MKSKKDKENEALSIFCGALVFFGVLFVIILGIGVNLAVDKVKGELHDGINRSGVSGIPSSTNDRS